jgi:SAM-dependent methyltransferase
MLFFVSYAQESLPCDYESQPSQVKGDDLAGSGPSLGRRREHNRIAYGPDLGPQPKLMRRELHDDVLEEWFRWAEEWSMLLRIYGGITRTSSVLEIGCGLGRTAFPLRYVLSSEGSYAGFDNCQYKVSFLERTFHQAYPHFRFTWADVYNAIYNPYGQIKPTAYRFPYPDASFDIVYAASVFTHMLPEAEAHYVRESARVLKQNGRCVFSFFLLDNYRPAQPRPFGFARPEFIFEQPYGSYGDDFAVGLPENPERMTAYRLRLIEDMTAKAHLSLAHAQVPGLWSGTTATWVGAQDLLVLVKEQSG